MCFLIGDNEKTTVLLYSWQIALFESNQVTVIFKFKTITKFVKAVSNRAKIQIQV